MDYKKVEKIGVLTGGGDCPGLNAVIRAVVKTAIVEYGWKVIGIRDGYEGLIKEGKTQYLLYDSVKGILSRGGTILGTSNRANPFAYAIKQGGKVITEDRSSVVLERIKDLEIDALIVIGGDGTLSIGKQLYDMGVPLVGVPKTIDNDLSATDITFGFDTAINTATDAIDKIRTTAESHHRVMIVEVMGRYAGWIALQAGIASGADIILIPEIPFHLDRICQVINERVQSGRTSSIIVVAEGAKPEGGEVVVKMTVEDSTDALRLGGIGNQIAAAITDEIHLETRVTVLGHIQRGGGPSAFDRILSTRFGVAAVELLAEGKFGRMVGLKSPCIDSAPLSEAVQKLKTVDPQGELVHIARSIGVSFGD
jgi:6-phosphofructokinase 1